MKTAVIGFSFAFFTAANLIIEIKYFLLNFVNRQSTIIQATFFKHCS